MDKKKVSPNIPHSNMTYADHVGTNPELTQEDYDRMIKEDKEKEVNDVWIGKKNTHP